MSVFWQGVSGAGVVLPVIVTAAAEDKAD